MENVESTFAASSPATTSSSRSGLRRSRRRGWLDWCLCIRVARPGRAEVADRGDAVLGLQVRQVVLLECDTAVAERGDDRFEIVDAKPSNGATALAGSDALVDDERAVAGTELRFAILGKIVAADLELESQRPAVEVHGLVHVGHGDDRSNLSTTKHETLLKFAK